MKQASFVGTSGLKIFGSTFGSTTMGLITMAAMLTSSALVSISNAYAYEDQGCGLNGGFWGNECALVVRYENVAISKRVLKKAVLGESYRCDDPSKETWVVQGIDRNLNGQLESGEVTRDSGHCEKLVFGKKVTVAEKLCDSASAVRTPFGIDEDLDGKVEAHEMHASASYCTARIVLTREQIAEIEEDERREAVIRKFEQSGGYSRIRY